MNFTKVIANAKRFAGTRTKGDSYDDFLIDRLHNRYTVAALVCFCIAVSTYQYSGNPLECWVPAQFTDNYEDYTNRLCYIQNTYHIAKDQSIPRDTNIRRERTLKYYQWINFLLLFQALFFSLPRILWQSLNNKIGLSIRNLVDASERCQSFDSDEDRGKIVQYIADCLQRYEEYVNPPRRENASYFARLNRQCRLVCQARTGANLAYFYLFIKCLYIFNLIFQILFLQYFLSYYENNYLQYGLNVFEKLFANSFSLPESQLFPRITLCDFQIRELAERHYYTVECILVINIFIEKMYFLLWIWFGVLLFLTIIDTLRIIYGVFLRHSRDVFITENLDLIISNPLRTEKQFRYFLRYFPIDNLFTLRVLSANCSSLIVAEILEELCRRKLTNDSDV